MPNTVTISKKIGKIVVVVHTESNISAVLAAKDAVVAIESVQKEK